MSARNEIQWAVNFFASSDEESDRITDEIYQAVRAEILREAADTISNSPVLVDYTDDHMGDIHAAAHLLRQMEEETEA